MAATSENTPLLPDHEANGYDESSRSKVSHFKQHASKVAISFLLVAVIAAVIVFGGLCFSLEILFRTPLIKNSQGIEAFERNEKAEYRDRHLLNTSVCSCSQRNSLQSLSELH
jgi:hypothetical protein